MPRMNSTLTYRIPALAFASLSFAACSAGGASSAATVASLANPPAAVSTTVDVSITGGYDTDTRDNGRPVVLVASLLGVAPEVFREAFSGVTPAKGAAPVDAQVKLNKQALLAVLGPYGVTNDALDAASNTYRYLASAGQTWDHEAATATATVVDGTVTAINVTDPGHGYTSIPTVTVTLPDGSTVSATATIAYTNDVATNGSISTITLPA
ncbi:MAG: hypothetical protein JWM34_5027 [Ilumatobacteraceae bacterium]|nr:hypothetical protein [Ilumatobacteraceae bacterium]